MKKSLVIVALASVALFSACQKEDVKIQSTGMQAVIAQDSKTDLDGLKVTWSAGDAFAVWNAGAKAGTYTLTSGAGTNQGSFEGTGAADGYIAVYPASSNLSTDYSSALANQTFGSNIN